MASNPRIPPSVNQIEVHPFNTQTAIREACARHGIVVEAYAPLARAMRMRNKTVVGLSQQYGCTPAQLLVRYVFCFFGILCMDLRVRVHAHLSGCATLSALAANEML
jgi:diketogulonate reductase-like aldo/keto reductase